jgi:hypothetical protein
VPHDLIESGAFWCSRVRKGRRGAWWLVAKWKDVSTSYVERHNPTMRMGMRRFTRLTNGFSTKIENHAAMVAIHAVYYNFGDSQNAEDQARDGRWSVRPRLVA